MINLNWDEFKVDLECLTGIFFSSGNSGDNKIFEEKNPYFALSQKLSFGEDTFVHTVKCDQLAMLTPVKISKNNN